MFGFERVFNAVNMLEKANLMAIPIKNNFPQLRQKLRLIDESKKEDELSRVFGGFAPVIPRICEIWGKHGIKAVDEVFKLLPGRFSEEKVPLPASLQERMAVAAAAAAATNVTLASPAKKTVTVVVFLGGVTMAEIAALKRLNQRDAHPVSYLIVTTGVISGDKLMSTFIDPLVNLLAR